MGTNIGELSVNYCNFNSRKCILKCHLQTISHFVQAPVCYGTTEVTPFWSCWCLPGRWPFRVSVIIALLVLIVWLYVSDTIMGGRQPPLPSPHSTDASRIQSAEARDPFYKGLGAHNWNLMEIILALVLIIMLQSCPNFAHVMTAEAVVACVKLEHEPIIIFHIRAAYLFDEIWIMSS